jgi:Uncharacterized protein family UPF0004
MGTKRDVFPSVRGFASTSAHRTQLRRCVILTSDMAGEPQKTFYLETFGCQMNAHDSEKVVGTLVSEGYRQVQTVEEAELVLYNTCSIRDKAE